MHWQAEPAQSLKDFLGELHDGYGGYFDDGFFKKAGGYVADLAMNYKFYLDSSVEALHAGYTHIQNNTGQNAQSGTALYLGQGMVTLHRNHRAISAPLGIGERDLAPMEALAFKYGGPTTPYDPRVRNRPSPPALNVSRLDNWAFDVLEVFPNTLIFQSAALYAVLSLWPSAVDRTLFDAQVYMPAPTNAAERVAIEYGLCPYAT